MQGTVLVVDDQEIGRITLEGFLLSTGCDLHFATCGPEALVILDTVRPDVILLDVMMPEMDGFTICRKIRANPLWRDIPIILVTALDDRASRIRGLEAGADEFVSKPVDWPELRARVQTTIELGRTRRQLQERARFEWAITHSSEGFLWLDAEGICQLANPAARAWLEMETPVLPEQVWLEHVAQAFTVQPPVTWPALRKAGVNFELSLIRPEVENRETLWLQVTGSPMPADEIGSAGWMLHIQDITALQMRMRQVLSLLNLIAHKLNTPLNQIWGPLDILQSGLITPASEDWQSLQQILFEGAKRLRQETSQVLNLAERLENPLISPRSEALSQRDIENSVRLVCQEFNLGPDHWVLEQNATRPLRLNLEALEMILRQLISNAVKFHPQQNPDLKIILRDESDNHIRLEVEDNGLGIPAELREQVWQPFYQIDHLGTGQVPGVGAGLPLVANYVWSAGGRCWIENAGPGTRVCLSLPVVNGGGG